VCVNYLCVTGYETPLQTAGGSILSYNIAAIVILCIYPILCFVLPAVIITLSIERNGLPKIRLSWQNHEPSHTRTQPRAHQNNDEAVYIVKKPQVKQDNNWQPDFNVDD
jgi:hypothetical protein